MAEPRSSTIDLPRDAHKSLLMIVLLADTPLPPVKEAHGTYHDIFTSLFRNSVQLAASQSEAKVTGESVKGKSVLTIESYDTVQGNYPSDARLKAADGLLITGSAASAYEDLPWITRLVSYTSKLLELNPDLKLIGICFGHQIIARAFGSSVEKNTKGWEVGVRKLDLTPAGRQIFGQSELTIHQMHQDHVPSLPASFELIGSTPVCEIQGMVRYLPGTSASARSLTDVDVLTLQGHPEFSPDIVLKVIEIRAAKGVFDSEMAEKSRGFARERDEGIEIGRVILQVLGL